MKTLSTASPRKRISDTRASASRRAAARLLGLASGSCSHRLLDDVCW